ncbi:outer membrane protein [Methylobacterium aerolatum]|uniref:Outer membrane immunogenic protein n=1 Tax=Methylobacterium aerolatum TaxID=418708 RepID=A0ABU0HTP7_9HYPH|nr:porin family protein [Methylobacterium aerolatum]MDQ0445704.1 outer membrane immunogenic protein [Methylobacterium aerolatum]GJD36186.1 hypothetical protein FMGBMHLM_3101 [Methylobacterium aerolatum]
MKRFVIHSVAAVAFIAQAQAADLPAKSPPVEEAAPAEPFSWTGYYLGFSGGYGTQHNVAKTSPAGDTGLFGPDDFAALRLNHTKFDGDGFVGGAHAGYNYQATPGTGIVVGVETDVALADIKQARSWGFSNSLQINGGFLTSQTNVATQDKLDFLGTVRGRIGYAFNRAFVYGTGGLAYGDTSYRHDITYVANYAPLNGAPMNASGQFGAHSGGMNVGVAYGGGIEYALPVNEALNLGSSSVVTLAGEYLHYDLGDRTVKGFTESGGRRDLVSSTKISTEGDIVRGRLSVKFGL